MGGGTAAGAQFAALWALFHFVPVFEIIGDFVEKQRFSHGDMIFFVHMLCTVNNAM